MTQKKLLVTFFCMLLLAGCKKDQTNQAQPIAQDYRQSMRDFVQSISSYAKGRHAGFLVLPQNGQALITSDGKATSPVSNNYATAIDGQALEDLYYGYDSDNVATTPDKIMELSALLPTLLSLHKRVLVTDYCTDTAKVNNSYYQNHAKGYISFAADHRSLDDIPSFPAAPSYVNHNDITKLADAKNYLYLINSEAYASKQDMVNAISATDYDLVIMDLYYNTDALTTADIATLRNKAGGGKRLLICYMSIGEAENYRYYWQSAWTANHPTWLEVENPQWPGNFAVQYWQQQWQQIIYGNDSSYTNKIIKVGFDGVMLDKVDEYEYFETK